MIHSSFLLLGAHLCKFVFSVVFERCTVASPLELVILPPARQIMRQSAALEPTAGRDGVDGDILPADMICKKLLQAQEDADAGATDGGGVRMEPPGKAQNRAATRQFAEALDAACRRTGGFSLADFATGGPSLPLTTDEVRYYATVMNPATGVEENRSCVFNTRRVCNLLVAKIQRGKKGLGAAAAVTTPTPGAGRPVGEVCGVGVGRSTIGDEVGSNRVGLWGRGGFIGVFFIARDTNTLHRSNRVGLETERSYADGKWVAPTVHWSSDMHSVEYGFFDGIWAEQAATGRIVSTASTAFTTLAPLPRAVLALFCRVWSGRSSWICEEAPGKRAAITRYCKRWPRSSSTAAAAGTSFSGSWPHKSRESMVSPL